MNKHFVAMATAALALLAAPGVRAQGYDPTAPAPVTDPAAPAGAGFGLELTSVLLGTGRTEVRVPLAIEMSSGTVAKPISIPVEIYYGVNEQLTVGLTHNGGVVQAVRPYVPGQSLCLGGDACDDEVYDNVAFDALYGILGGTLQLAAHGGLDILSFSDPFALALRLGVLFQAPLATNLVLITDPRVWIGITGRDRGNKEFLELPLGVQFWITPQARVAGRTVLSGFIDGFGDSYFGALGVFGAFAVNDLIELFGSFDFTNLYGKGNSADFRTLTLGANLRL